MERRAVRRDRHAARRWALALPLAALVLALGPTTGRAGWTGAGGAALTGFGLSDTPDWWREVGRPGGWPDAAAGDGYPWALAGLAVGAWDVAEPVAGARNYAFPGPASAREPLAWFDSLEVSAAEGAGWRGYDAALAQVHPGPETSADPRTHAVFHFLDGDFGQDETGLTIERGDSLKFLRGGAFSAKRGPRGPLGMEGRHTWGVQARMTLGVQTLEAGFAQRGLASDLQSGEQQSIGGEGGRLAWRYAHGGLHAGFSASRERDEAESFLPDRDVDTGSRRDAERNTIALDAGMLEGGRDLSARVEWSESNVRRDQGPVFDLTARSLWTAVRLTQPTADGMIDLAVGAGRHDAIGGWDVAPSAAYRFTSGDFRGRVVAERMLTPVWSDLAPGVNPFLQRTWVAGWDVHSEARGSVGGELGLLLGTTQDRAIVQRLPLEEMWLRNGLVPDTGRYDFGLFTAGAHWQGRVLLGTADGFALAREKSAVQPAVDPPYGGRGSLGFGFQAFQRDLDVKLRVEVEGVGPRESETAVPQRIPGYASLGFAAALTLRDATLTFRAQNLEDQGRLQTWIDPNTGRLALGVGREIHFEFAWKLFN